MHTTMVVLLREGELNFNQRRKRQQALVNALVARDEPLALQLLEEDIQAELQIAAPI